MSDFQFKLQKNRSDDEGSVGGPGAASEENSLVISDIVLVSNEGIRAMPTLGNGLPSALQLQGDEAAVAAASQNGGSGEYLREEHAAVKAQAAFRGYLVILSVLMKSDIANCCCVELVVSSSAYCSVSLSLKHTHASDKPR